MFQPLVREAGLCDENARTQVEFLLLVLRALEHPRHITGRWHVWAALTAALVIFQPLLQLRSHVCRDTLAVRLTLFVRQVVLNARAAALELVLAVDTGVGVVASPSVGVSLDDVDVQLPFVAFFPRHIQRSLRTRHHVDHHRHLGEHGGGFV